MSKGSCFASFFKDLFFIHVCICMYICAYPKETTRSVRSLGDWSNMLTTQCTCWKPNSGSLEEQQVLLPIKTLFQLYFLCFDLFVCFVF